jgi:cytochrome c oxidase subunit 2
VSAGSNAERYEKAFLGLSAVMLVLFLGALFYAATAMGISLPSRAGELDPNEVRTTPPFDDPGIRQLGPDRYEVVMIGQAWGFVPRELTLPAGAEIVFRVTSPDVIHGFDVEGTRLNAMLIPGQITELSYTFREPGKHLIICHEYCGIGHHEMYGTIEVVAPEDFEMPADGEAAAEEAGAGESPEGRAEDPSGAGDEGAAAPDAGGSPAGEAQGTAGGGP